MWMLFWIAFLLSLKVSELLVRLRLFSNLSPCPLPLDKGFSLKEQHPCHPERSEGSGGGEDYLCTASPTHRFFVTSFLRMTFEVRPLIRGRGNDFIREAKPLFNSSRHSRGGRDFREGLRPSQTPFVITL